MTGQSTMPKKKKKLLKLKRQLTTIKDRVPMKGTGMFPSPQFSECSSFPTGK
jgi:hypothetical protein